MRRWVLDLTNLKKDMVKTLNHWTGMVIYPYPIPHATVYWDYSKIEEHGRLFWIDRLAFKHHYLYGEGELPEVDGVVYWIPISREELMPFLLLSNELVIEVYETAEDLTGDIVVAVNGVPVRQTNKKRMAEKTRKEVRHENE